MMESDAVIYVRAVFALAFVIGLIYLLAAIIRRTGLDKRIIGSSSVTKRMAIIETTYLDPKNRLVLIKKDNKEHLLLLGASGNLLVESRDSGEKS